jgi:hypothetical protein
MIFRQFVGGGGDEAGRDMLLISCEVSLCYVMYIYKLPKDHGLISRNTQPSWWTLAR